MKIIFRKLVKDGSGSIKVECEEPEDFWHIYNLIRESDIITSVTLRKIAHTTSTGSTQQQKKKIHLSIKIDTIEYDTETCSIRVKGKNIRENKYVSLGQSHTISLALHRAFTIEKKRWDKIDLDRIDMASDPSKHADCAIIVMQQGLAHLMLITSHMTLDRCKITKTIPRKRIGSTTRYDKAILKFYDLILDSIVRHINFDIIKCIVLASPAFIKDDCYEYIFKQCNKLSCNDIKNDINPYKIILLNKDKFIKGHCSSGHRGAVKEVLSDSDMQKKLGNTKASEQIDLLDDFFKMLNNDETRAIYGQRHVTLANQSKAIDKLMITDSLFRNKNVKTRKQYVDLVESCENNGAKIYVFSSLHVSGEQLNQITGIAALLRFPMPELLELGDTDDEEDDQDNSESENDDEDYGNMGLTNDYIDYDENETKEEKDNNSDDDDDNDDDNTNAASTQNQQNQSKDKSQNKPIEKQKQKQKPKPKPDPNNGNDVNDNDDNFFM